jgi:hypothetical protein
MNLRIYSLLLLLIFNSSVMAEQFTVICSAKKSFYCEPEKCEENSGYEATFYVDLKAQTIVRTSVRNLSTNEETIPDDAKYQILGLTNDFETDEYALLAVGKPGTAAVENLILGEKSYVSSRIGGLKFINYSQFGTCRGLKFKEKINKDKK